MKIRVKNFRVISKASLIFIESTEHSVGYLISFFSLFTGPKIRIRRLDGIRTEHLLSQNGVFSFKSLSQMYFHYFTVKSSGLGSTLAYSLDISMSKCFISLKSKSPNSEVSEIAITVSDNRGKIETLKIKAQTSENTATVTTKMLKPMQIKSLDEMKEFKIDLLKHFEFKGQGIDIKYPLTTSKPLQGYFYLEADTSLPSYEIDFMDNQIYVNYIQKVSSSRKNLTLLKVYDPLNPEKESVVIFDGFKYWKTLMKDSKPITEVRAIGVISKDGE